MELSRVNTIKATTVFLLFLLYAEVTPRAIEDDPTTAEPFQTSQNENFVIDLINDKTTPSSDESSTDSGFQPISEFRNPVMENLLINAIKSSAAMVSQIEGINKYAIMLNTSERKKVDVHLLPVKISSTYREKNFAKTKSIPFDSSVRTRPLVNIPSVKNEYNDIDDLSNSILKKRHENSLKFLDAMKNNSTNSTRECDCDKKDSKVEENVIHTHIASKTNATKSIKSSPRANEILALNAFTKVTELEQSNTNQINVNVSDNKSLNDIDSKITKKIDNEINLPIENLFNMTEDEKISIRNKNCTHVDDESNRNTLLSNNAQQRHSKDENSIMQNSNVNNTESDSRGRKKNNSVLVKVNKVKNSNNDDVHTRLHATVDDTLNLEPEEKENYPDPTLFKTAVKNVNINRFAAHKIPDYVTERNRIDTTTYPTTTEETTEYVSPTKNPLKSSKSLTAKVGGFLREDSLDVNYNQRQISPSSLQFDLSNIKIEQPDFNSNKSNKRLENSRPKETLNHPGYLKKVNLSKSSISKSTDTDIDDVELTTEVEYSTQTVNVISSTYSDFSTTWSQQPETTTGSSNSNLRPSKILKDARSSSSSPITYVKNYTGNTNRRGNERYSLNAGFLNISHASAEIRDKNEITGNKNEGDYSTQKSDIKNTVRYSSLYDNTVLPTTTVKPYFQRSASSYTTSSYANVPRRTILPSSSTDRYLIDASPSETNKRVNSDRGNKKFIPSKFETISSFISDSQAREIYSENDDEDEEDKKGARINPNLVKERGPLRHINFTRQSADDISKTESPIRTTVTRTNNQNRFPSVQLDYSSKDNREQNNFDLNNKSITPTTRFSIEAKKVEPFRSNFAVQETSYSSAGFTGSTRNINSGYETTVKYETTTTKPIRFREESTTTKPIRFREESTTTTKPIRFREEPTRTTKPIHFGEEPTTTIKPIRFSEELTTLKSNIGISSSIKTNNYPDRPSVKGGFSNSNEKSGFVLKSEFNKLAIDVNEALTTTETNNQYGDSSKSGISSPSSHIDTSYYQSTIIPSDSSTSTRLNFNPGESGFRTSQAGKSTLYSGANRYESSTEYTKTNTSSADINDRENNLKTDRRNEYKPLTLPDQDAKERIGFQTNSNVTSIDVNKQINSSDSASSIYKSNASSQSNIHGNKYSSTLNRGTIKTAPGSLSEIGNQYQNIRTNIKNPYQNSVNVESHTTTADSILNTKAKVNINVTPQILSRESTPIKTSDSSKLSSNLNVNSIKLNASNSSQTLSLSQNKSDNNYNNNNNNNTNSNSNSGVPNLAFDLQHGASHSNKLASSYVGVQGDKSYRSQSTDSNLDEDGQERGSKKYVPTKFETFSPFLTDSNVNKLYGGDTQKSQFSSVGKSNTIKYDEGTLTIQDTSASIESGKSTKYKGTKHQYRGNVKYHWDPVDNDWSNDDGDFPAQFSYNYNTPTGIKAYQKGVLREINNQKVFIIKGSYEYISPDGSPVVVNYTADEFGFHPQVVTPLPSYDNVHLDRDSLSKVEEEEVTEDLSDFSIED